MEETSPQFDPVPFQNALGVQDEERWLWKVAEVSALSQIPCSGLQQTFVR